MDPLVIRRRSLDACLIELNDVIAHRCLPEYFSLIRHRSSAPFERFRCRWLILATPLTISDVVKMGEIHAI